RRAAAARAREAVIRPASKLYDGLTKSREVGYYQSSAFTADEVVGDQITNDQSRSVYEFRCNGWLYPAALMRSNRRRRAFPQRSQSQRSADLLRLGFSPHLPCGRAASQEFRIHSTLSAVPSCTVDSAESQSRLAHQFANPQPCGLNFGAGQS